MKLYENGVYLLNGADIVEDAGREADPCGKDRERSFQRGSGKEYDRIFDSP